MISKIIFRYFVFHSCPTPDFHRDFQEIKLQKHNLYTVSRRKKVLGSKLCKSVLRASSLLFDTSVLYSIYFPAKCRVIVKRRTETLGMGLIARINVYQLRNWIYDKILFQFVFPLRKWKNLKFVIDFCCCLEGMFGGLIVLERHFTTI